MRLCLSTSQECNHQVEEKPKNNLGDLARKMRLELELGEKKKREQEALALLVKKDQEEKVTEDAVVTQEVDNQQVSFSVLICCDRHTCECIGLCCAGN